ncbi:MAG: putative 4,5-dihydroxyphthalate dehydrogenase [Pelotomaculum sp. PtaB.Bin013]|uniref:Gfo/Idh/MocA family oxidoreductase n=1 Tax=Pelotomaculum isophthalicicum JI TaxID=947010 RepID=A0A9X4JVR7_9FIRM|nr:Gfo/Idh/MocA family oxidoreductase [Pelotomaculum isophthalicicum]MDF9407872.1 Gfo/Idh/MocA family oxidoreductase [Pelotomaculum isophthalicicum JI]OPX88877.1 MAG: putative 4,5-dihydroxyphthalate dehydrogenase [Pelotomaculum sp. PtaB.Bin013]
MAGIKFGIAGCGRIARVHANEIVALPQAELVAVNDIDPFVLKNFASYYNVKGYRDYKKMLEERDLDVVVICTPSGLHAKMGILAARSGKHVLVEKPLALSLSDADMLVNTCEKAGVILSVVMQKRFNRFFQILKSAIDDGRFGKLSHATATVRWNRDEAYFLNNPWRGKRAEDGGVMMNQAIHIVDILSWLMGSVESVFAYTATRCRPIETEDVGVAVLKFGSGALGTIEAATTVYPRNLEQTIAVFGERGTVVIGGEKADTVMTWRFSETREEDQMVCLKEEAKCYMEPGHQAVLQDMVKAILTGGRPVVDGREGRKALEIVLGIYRSAETGMPVNFR